MNKPADHPGVIATPDAPVEHLKNRIIAGLFVRDADNLTDLVHVACHTAAIPDLGETDEKFLRQILTALTRYRHQPGFPSGLKKQTLQLRSLLADKVRQAEPGYLTCTDWKARLDLTPWQKQAVFSQAITFQMTSGCSNFCRRCNEWALPKTRSHFTFDAVKRFIQTLLEHGNRDLALYGGSDPLDWCDPPYDITHVFKDLNEEIQFSLLTKVPKGTEALAKKLETSGIPLSVSLTDRNRPRINALEKEMDHPFTKQHATSDLLIPAGLDEDFSTVKPSITDGYGTELSPDGVFAIIPAFTSALHPFGHKKIRITVDTPFLPAKKLGRPALLVDYFKPMEVITAAGSGILPDLLDIQVENILLDNGHDALTPPGMRSIREYFDIFSDKARQRRKKLTPAVVKRLKAQYLHDTNFKNLTPACKKKLKKQILAHVEFTKETYVASALICSVSYFLASVHAYLKDRPVKQQIIRHLTRLEYVASQQWPVSLSTPIHVSLETRAIDPWLVFRGHTLNLIHKGDPKPVVQFTLDYPARFHPEKDRFVNKK